MDRLQNAFEVCLAAMEFGVELETCLTSFPDLAAELKPMLETAQAAQMLAVKEVPNAAANRSRAKMLAQAAEMRPSRRTVFPLFRLPRLALSLTAFLIVLFVSLNGLVVTSAKSLPGDALYPVKRAAENVRLQLAPNIEVKYRIAEQYNQLRAEEVERLISLNRVEPVSLEGIVTEITPDRWKVENIPVVITPETKIIGDIIPGKVIEVEGFTQSQGWVVAEELRLRYDEYSGEITAIEPRQWKIDGTTVNLLSNTQIDPSLRLGDRAVVLVYWSDSGMLYARAIVAFPKGAADFDPFEIEFNGVIEAIAGNTLTIDGKSITLSDTTELSGDLSIGTQVKVHAIVGADGSLTAIEINADSADVQSSNVVEDDHQGSQDKQDDDILAEDEEKQEDQDHDDLDESEDYNTGSDDDQEEDASGSDDQNDDDQEDEGEDRSGEGEDGDDTEDNSEDGDDEKDNHGDDDRDEGGDSEDPNDDPDEGDDASSDDLSTSSNHSNEGDGS